MIGQAMLENFQQMSRMQQHHNSPAFTQGAGNQHQGHYSHRLPIREHLPALPPPVQQPIHFAEYPHAQPVTQSAWVEVQPTVVTSAQPTQQYQQPIPQPFIPSSVSAIVPATTAQIVPVSAKVQPLPWLRSLSAGFLSRLLQSRGVSVVLVAAVFAASMFGASKLTAPKATLTINDLLPPAVSPSPTPSPSSSIPTIQASPRPASQTAPKEKAKPAHQTTTKPVVEVPCLPIPVTEEGC